MGFKGDSDMFITCKKNLEIREKGNTVAIPKDFVGELPSWAENNWLVKAAILDGVIIALKNSSDRELERAEEQEKVVDKTEEQGKVDEATEGEASQKGRKK